MPQGSMKNGMKNHAAVWCGISKSRGSVSLHGFIYSLPFFCEEKCEHAEHSETEAYREACHYVSAVDKIVDEISDRNTHSPQHEQIYYCRVADFAETVDKAYYSAKHGVGPGEWEDDADVSCCYSQHLGVIVEQGKQGLTEDGEGYARNAGD